MQQWSKRTELLFIWNKTRKRQLAQAGKTGWFAAERIVQLSQRGQASWDSCERGKQAAQGKRKRWKSKCNYSLRSRSSVSRMHCLLPFTRLAPAESAAHRPKAWQLASTTCLMRCPHLPLAAAKCAACRRIKFCILHNVRQMDNVQPGMAGHINFPLRSPSIWATSS